MPQAAPVIMAVAAVASAGAQIYSATRKQKVPSIGSFASPEKAVDPNEARRAQSRNEAIQKISGRAETRVAGQRFGDVGLAPIRRARLLGDAV